MDQNEAQTMEIPPPVPVEKENAGHRGNGSIDEEVGETEEVDLNY